MFSKATPVSRTKIVSIFTLILLLLFLLPFLLFSANINHLADLVVANLLIGNFYNPVLTSFFLCITALANAKFVISLILLLGGIFIYQKNRHYLYTMILSVSGSQIFVHLQKMIFQRERPSASFLIESGYSFPSGHAAVAVVLYGFLLCLVYRHVKKIHYQLGLAVILVLLILLIGLSRIYLGVHYFTDVVFGYFVGLTWLSFAVKVTNLNASKKLYK